MKRWLQKLFTGGHAALYRLSGGRLAGRMGGGRVVLLTTTGRKSGKRRTTPLISFEHGGDIVLIASNGGGDSHPAWWLNLRAHPAATIRRGREELGVTARAAQGEERAQLWSRIVEGSKQYTGYQAKTSREIPVVVLERAATPS